MILPAGALLAFAAASLALAAAPGPTVALIIANGLRHGARAGLVTVMGTQLGVALWLGVGTFGLTALAAGAGLWFDLLRYAAAAWLIWLAIGLFRAQGDMVEPGASGGQGFFLQGFLVILTNPKMLVLFGALIPAFLPPGADPARLTLFLGLTFALVACAVDCVYALVAGGARGWLSRGHLRAIERVSGGLLAVAAILIALKGR